MTIQLVELRSPYASDYASISYRNFFDGTDQILMTTYNYDYNYSGGNNSTYTKKEPIKVLLESISYELTDGEIIIRTLECFGFRKDKKIRARSYYFYNNQHNPQFADLLPQIPDSFHNKARTFFDETLKKLSDELLEARQKGLQIK